MAENETQELTPANQNPWYVLMTLYGEQDGKLIDHTKHEKNRRAWNAWAGQGLSPEDQQSSAKSSDIDVAELRAWHALKDEITRKHAEVWRERNGDLDYPGLPSVKTRIDLSKTTFCNRVVLQKVVFASVAEFNSATFRAAAYFTSATFRAAAGFTSATFRAAAFFTSTTFRAVAEFHSTKFKGPVKFVGSRFLGVSGEDETGAVHVTFVDATFEKPASFRGARFVHLYPVLAGAVLHNRTEFSEDPDLWPKTMEQAPKTVRETCAIIRHALTQQGLTVEAHFFFQREMRAAEDDEPRLRKVPYFLFRVFSNYGESIAYPTWWLVGCWALGVAAYWGYFASTGGGLGTAMALSFSNLFPIFGFGRLYLREVIGALPPPLIVWSGFQAVFSLPMLFFLGLGLRQRFRLR